MKNQIVTEVDSRLRPQKSTCATGVGLGATVSVDFFHRRGLKVATVSVAFCHQSGLSVATVEVDLST
jgi:hypothetical protein